MSLKKLGKKAFDILRGIAPVAAGALGGPYGGAVSAILAKTLDVDETKIDDFILSADPEQLLKLKLAEHEVLKWSEELGLREEQLVVEDRKDARDMAIAKGIRVQALLSGLFIGGYFGLIAILIINHDHMSHLSAAQMTLLSTLIGVLTAAIPQILAFWFGTSTGSKEKTEAMSEALRNAT